MDSVLGDGAADARTFRPIRLVVHREDVFLLIELDSGKGGSYYLAWNSGDWHLCVGGTRVLSLLPAKEPLPRELRIHEAVRRIGERLRSSMEGNGAERRTEARRLADKMGAIEALLRSD